MSSINFASAFDLFNEVRLRSPTLEDIWRTAYSTEYAAEARPNAFYPSSVLDSIISLARDDDASNQKYLDIGCGHGLTGLFLARRLGMTLFGIDISPGSINLARHNASQKPDVLSRFEVAHAHSTGLDDSSCSLVSYPDVLLYLPDKSAILQEIYRVLKPGGIFAFTTWEQHGFNPRLAVEQFSDYRPLLLDAGLEVLTYEAVDGAREQQQKVFDGLVERESELRAGIGNEATSMFVNMAKSGRKESDSRRYVFGICRAGTKAS